MERFYRFAGITFRVTGAEGDMYRDDGVLAAFRTEGPAADHHIDMEIVRSLPAPEGICVFSDTRKRIFRDGEDELCCLGDYLQILRRGNRTRVQILRREVPERIMPRLVLNSMEAEYHIVKRGGFLLHASFICWEGRAILFTAPSGTGKSTQAELWHSLRGAEPVNGDRAAVMREPEGFVACGIPFCGTSGICRNIRAPLGAIVCLSQAPETTIRPLTGLRAFRGIWEGCSVHVWDREALERCSQTVMEAVEKVPVFHLACRPDESAVIALEEALKELR